MAIICLNDARSIYLLADTNVIWKMLNLFLSLSYSLYFLVLFKEQFV